MIRNLHNPRIGAFLLLGVAIVAFAILYTDMRTDIRDFFFPGAAVDAGFRVGQQQAEQLSRRYIVSVTHAGDNESTARVLVVTPLGRATVLSDKTQCADYWRPPSCDG